MIIDTNIVRGCNNTSPKLYSEICIILVFDEINAGFFFKFSIFLKFLTIYNFLIVDSSLSVKILFQYEAVSILKSELKPYSRMKYNSLGFTIENENNYHINNVQINVTFDFYRKPFENLTAISPENYQIISSNNKISTISWDFFEIRNNEAWEIQVRFDEIIHGCLDSKSFLYNNEKDSSYLLWTWIILVIFLFLLMLILYCGEITNLNKKLK